MNQSIRIPIEYLAIYPFSSKALKATRELKSSLFPGHGTRLKRFVCVHVSFLRSNSRNYFTIAISVGNMQGQEVINQLCN